MDIKEKIKLVEERFHLNMIIRILNKYILLDDGRKIYKKDIIGEFELYSIISQQTT